MNVKLVLSQLDSLIENRRTDLVEGYLREKMEEAAEEGDRRAVITLINELISYYGGTRRKRSDKSGRSAEHSP